MNYKKEEQKEEAITKGATAANSQAFFERRLNMACNHTRKIVSGLVLNVIRDIQDDPSIIEVSVFGPQGINNDRQFRATYFTPIKTAVETGECRLKKFSSADCEKAKSVKDIVDAVWNDFKPEA